MIQGARKDRKDNPKNEQEREAHWQLDQLGVAGLLDTFSS